MLRLHRTALTLQAGPDLAYGCSIIVNIMTRQTTQESTSQLSRQTIRYSVPRVKAQTTSPKHLHDGRHDELIVRPSFHPGSFSDATPRREPEYGCSSEKIIVCLDYD